MSAATECEAPVNPAEEIRARQAAKRDAARERLLGGPILPTLLNFALPILGSSVLQSLNLTANQFWIARSLDETAITAAGNGNVVMQLMIAGTFGLSSAANILVSQAVGAGSSDRLKSIVGTAITCFAVLSLVLALAGVTFTPGILHLMGTPDASRIQAQGYLRIMCLALPLLLAFQFIQMSQQAAGDSRRPFYFLLLAVALDMTLNPLLIRGVGPFPRMGVPGAAVATLTSQAISLCAMFVYLYRSHSPLALRRGDLHHLRPDWTILRTLLVRGLPISTQGFMWNGSAAVMIGMVNRYGPVTAAAYTAFSQMANYVQMPAQALGAASTAMAAQNIGAGNWPRVDKVAAASVLSALATTVTISSLLYALGPHALHIFLPGGSPSVAVAMHINALALWSFALYSVTLQLIGIVRSTGAVYPPMIVVFIALVCVRISFAGLLQPYWGADAIWISFPVGILVSITLNTLYFRFGGWRKLKLLG